LTVAFAFGMPLGTVVGDYFSWRAAFVLMGVLGTVALLGISAFLPALENPPLVSLCERLGVVEKPAIFVTLSLTATGLRCGLVMFTYIGALLCNLTGFGEIGVSVMLFFFGIAGVAGNALGGYDAGRWGYWRSLATILRHSHPLPARLLASDARSRLAAHCRQFRSGVGRQERGRWALMPFQQYRPIDLAPRIQNVVLSANASSIYLGLGIGAGLCYFAILYGSLTSLSWVATL